jgi:hypothetical protein
MCRNKPARPPAGVSVRACRFLACEGGLGHWFAIWFANSSRADVCLHRQSGPIRREALRQLLTKADSLAGPIAEAHRKHGSGAISEREYRQARELITAWPE